MLNFETYEIERLANPDPDESGESFKMEFEPTGEILTGYEEQASPEFAAMVDGEFGKTFRIFSDDVNADVKIGDRLIRQSDDEIREVKGVQRHSNGPGRKIEIVSIKLIQQ